MEDLSVEYKQKGNAHFKKEEYRKAINCYEDALLFSPDDHTLYSNISGSYLGLNLPIKALDTAKKVVELQPKWPKGHSRAGAAHHALGDLEQAEVCYSLALKLDPENKIFAENVKNIRTEIFKEEHQRNVRSVQASNAMHKRKSEAANALSGRTSQAMNFAVPDKESLTTSSPQTSSSNVTGPNSKASSQGDRNSNCSLNSNTNDDNRDSNSSINSTTGGKRLSQTAAMEDSGRPRTATNLFNDMLSYLETNLPIRLKSVKAEPEKVPVCSGNDVRACLETFLTESGMEFTKEKVMNLGSRIINMKYLVAVQVKVTSKQLQTSKTDLYSFYNYKRDLVLPMSNASLDSLSSDSLTKVKEDNFIKKRPSSIGRMSFKTKFLGS